MAPTIDELAVKIDFLEKQLALVMTTHGEQQKQEESKPKGKSTKKEKPAKEDKPKRKPSGYNLFCKAMRDDAKEAVIEEEDLEEGKKPSNQAIMSKLGAMWKELSEEEQQEWKNKASADEVDIE